MRRRYDREIMDDFTITDERIVRALDELRVINRFLGGRSASKSGLKDLFEKDAAASQRDASIGAIVLDVGAGGSDVFEAARVSGRPLEIISVDINTGVCRYVKARDVHSHVVCADARALPFCENSVDIVHVSLFLHHFAEEEIVRLLQTFLRIARMGVVINDLHRSAAALAGITLLTRIFSHSSMVKNDGPLSVKRGFARSELQAVLNRLQGVSYTLTWRWAFRWLAVVHKEASYGS